MATKSGFILSAVTAGLASTFLLTSAVAQSAFAGDEVVEAIEGDSTPAPEITQKTEDSQPTDTTQAEVTDDETLNPADIAIEIDDLPDPNDLNPQVYYSAAGGQGEPQTNSASAEFQNGNSVSNSDSYFYGSTSTEITHKSNLLDFLLKWKMRMSANQ